MEISSSLRPKLPSLPFCASPSTFFSNRIETPAVYGIRRRRNSGSFSRSGEYRARRGLACNALFGLGVPELVVIAGVAALVFGPKQLPEIGRSIGKTVKSFQQAAKEFESELKKEPESITESSAQESEADSPDKKDESVPSAKESA